MPDYKSPQTRSRKSRPPMFRQIQTSRWYTMPAPQTSRKKRTDTSRKKKYRKTKVRNPYR